MAWTSPMTAVTGNVFTAAQFNQHVRDNLLMTEAAVADAPASLLVTTGANTVDYRTPTVEYIGSFETTTNTSYTNLGTTGPTITETTGTKALVSFGAHIANNTAGLGSRVSYEISGASTQAAGDSNSYYAESGNAGDGFQGTWTTITQSLNAGSNVFQVKYRTTAGGGTSTFGRRLLVVVSF